MMKANKKLLLVLLSALYLSTVNAATTLRYSYSYT